MAEAEGDMEAVKVFVRIRPLNKRELAENQTIGWDFSETSMLEDTPNGQRVYAYDTCFGPSSTNQETYDIVGKPVVLKAMEGYNGTVFTYGQTGSGKTWTMRGCESDPGMMILCIRDILEFVRKHEEKMVITLRVSYLEVYNEEINDLLGEVGSAASKNLKIVSEDAARGAVIGGLVEEQASSPEEFMAILQRGEASRSYASTEMNNESSRSHTIYRVSIDTRERLPSGAPSVASRVSYLNLVDLAGSERQKSTKAEGKTLKEGANINKSLLALGAVINKLGDSGKKSKGKQAFIPYRDSKLTRILKQSLGGNTMTSVLCAVTPAPMHREETVSTLKFGQLCKMIKNSVKTNDGALDDKQLIRQYRNTISELQAQLKELQKIVAQSPEMLAAAATAAAERQAAGTEGGTSTSVSAAGTSGSAAASVDAEELVQLNEKLVEQQGMIAAMQQRLEEYRDLEESKAAFEEYEQHSRQELDEDIAKLEDEKAQLQNERYKILKDRSAVDEKESRIGLLITHLDEKESKLRQTLRTVTDQEEQWQRSVNDLKRREDLVNDWQANHQQQEKRLKDSENMQQRKFAELNLRESEIADNEAKVKAAQRELQEREQRLQVALSRVANSEQAMSALEDKLKDFEATLKKRENGADVRERDLQSRRKEMESWDVLLREKDKKISDSQHKLDEREAAISSSEDRAKQRDIEYERRMQELRQGELKLIEEKEKYSALLEEVEHRDLTTQQQQKESIQLKAELDAKQIELTAWQEKLKLLQERMKVVEQRESDINERVKKHEQTEFQFFNVKVAQITSRHTKELKELQDMVQQQLKIVADFQKELSEARNEINQRDVQIEELEATLDQQNIMIDSMKDQLSMQSDEEDVLSIYSTESATALGTHEKERGGQHSDDEEHSIPPGTAQHNASNASNANCSKHINFTPFGASRASPMPGAVGNTTSTIAAAAGTGGSVDVQQHHQQQHQQQQQQVRSGLLNASLLGLTPGQEFLLQLAITQKALKKVLEQHDALPDEHTSHAPKRRNPYESVDLSHIDENGEYIPQHPNTKQLFNRSTDQFNMHQKAPDSHQEASELWPQAAAVDPATAAAQRRLSTVSLPSSYDLQPSPAPTALDMQNPHIPPRVAMMQSIKTEHHFSRGRRLSAVSLPDTASPAASDPAAAAAVHSSETSGTDNGDSFSPSEGAAGAAGSSARKPSAPQLFGVSPDAVGGAAARRRSSISSTSSAFISAAASANAAGNTAASSSGSGAAAAAVSGAAEEKDEALLASTAAARLGSANIRSASSPMPLAKQQSIVKRTFAPPASVRWGHHNISTVLNRSPSTKTTQGHQFSRANRNLISAPSSSSPKAGAGGSPVVRRTNSAVPGSAQLGYQQKSPPWVAGGIVSSNRSPHSPSSAAGAGASSYWPAGAEDSTLAGNVRSPPPSQHSPPPPLVQTGGQRNGVPVTTVNLLALSNVEVKKAVQEFDIAELMHAQAQSSDSLQEDAEGEHGHWDSGSDSTASSLPPSPPPFDSSFKPAQYDNTSFNTGSNFHSGRGYDAGRNDYAARSFKAQHQQHHHHQQHSPQQLKHSQQQQQSRSRSYR